MLLSSGLLLIVLCTTSVSCACYSPAQNRTFAVGDSWDEADCTRAECVDDWLDGLPGVLLIGCQYFGEENVGDNCDVIEADPKAVWPACCRSVHCDSFRKNGERENCDDASCQNRPTPIVPESKPISGIIRPELITATAGQAITTQQPSGNKVQKSTRSDLSSDNSTFSFTVCSDVSCGNRTDVVETSESVVRKADQTNVRLASDKSILSILSTIARAEFFNVNTFGAPEEDGAKVKSSDCLNETCSRSIVVSNAQIAQSAGKNETPSELSVDDRSSEQDKSGQSSAVEVDTAQTPDHDDHSPSDLFLSASAAIASSKPASLSSFQQRKSNISVAPFSFTSPEDLTSTERPNSSANKSQVEDDQQRNGTLESDLSTFLLPLSSDSSPCLQDNGGCSHSCSVDVSWRVKCSCPDHMVVSSDERTCREKSDRTRLLFSSRHELMVVEVDADGADLTEEHRAQTVVSGLSNAVGVDYDWRRQCLYWTVVQSSGSIYRMCRGEQPVVLWSDGLRPDNVAVDWVTGNIYWTDGGLATIAVSDRHGRRCKTLVSAGIEKPRAIVFYQEKGRLYYTDWGRGAAIGQVAMDGSGHWLIVTSGLVWPNALTLSRSTRQLFWADARMGHIESADLNGANRRLLLRSPTARPVSALQHIFSMAVHDGRLFWTSWESGSVLSYNGTHAVTVARCASLPMAVRVFHPDQQPMLEGGNPCAPVNGTEPCGGLCVLGSSSSAICVCPDQLQLTGRAVAASAAASNNTDCLGICSGSQFRCRSTLKCISRWLVCNNQDDCGDGSDEPSLCPIFRCNSGQVQCRTGQCIDTSQFCDGVADCFDGADELECGEK